jgi:periplasmic divalent cation tolerance protein
MISIGWTTTSSQALAETMGRALVAADLAFCAQVEGPITSIYNWEGEIQNETEWRLKLKFLTPHGDAIAKRLGELHPYENPQWVTVKADSVGEKYLSWAKANSSSLPFNAPQAPI